MTGRERQLKGKKYPVIEEQEVNYTALLAFIGIYMGEKVCKYAWEDGFITIHMWEDWFIDIKFGEY